MFLLTKSNMRKIYLTLFSCFEGYSRYPARLFRVQGYF